MKVAYIAQAHGTALHRAQALERLGHSITTIDPWSWLGRSPWVGRWRHHTGALGVWLWIDRRLVEAVRAVGPDLVLVNQGEFIGPGALRRLRRLEVPLVNYTNDNPFTDWNSRTFRYYRKALRYYDLLAIVREENVAQAQTWGLRNVLRVWMSADEIAHRPRVLDAQTRERFASEVAFIGTWMPERGAFMAELVRRGVPLSIWGGLWQKAPEWPMLKPCWRGDELRDVDDYAAAIQSAKICIGLLSKGNRDLHTRRSVEIPALGGLLCAERTDEHRMLYEEDREAVFWRDAEECAAQCRRLLDDDTLRRSIAGRGHQRALVNNHFNEPLLEAMIARAERAFQERR